MRHRLTRSLTALLLLATAATPLRSAQETPQQPNVLFIISDDAGYADFGFHGASKIHTPNIDKLAASGINCSQAYVSASVCAPSRMGMMTGRYQQRFGAECNVPYHPTPGYSKNDMGLDTDECTLGEAMQSAGYRTMMIGKWHLGEVDPKYNPLKRGFDEFYGFLGGGRTYLQLDKSQPHEEGHLLYRNETEVDETKEVTYLTDNFTDAAIDFIERTPSEQPFFVYLSYNAVHTPMEAKTEDIEQADGEITEEKRRIYAAMTESMDDNVGRLLAFLDQKKLTENTLVVFVNDNGGSTANASANNPLRGFKGSYWEGGIRIPYVLSWPGVLPAGTTYDQPASTLDLFPTFQAAAGSTCETKPLDGKNLLPFLTGEQSGQPHDTLYWRLWQAAAVRHGNWKLIRVAEDPLQENPKLLAPLILIDLESDPAESKNLAVERPEIAHYLQKKLEEWESGLAQPRWYDGDDWKKWAAVQVKNHQMDANRYQ